ncbi:amyloid-beta A4 precursor protein-binding family A member 2 isoform X1 [Morone saxatilis]|uniref:amyloid-beta A4 precursor protein-binding family A member 2 isoform X1 n=1 Tax=Morone saxatilis TaxID=34816 RepID=UPI0015E23263|nr:amyloid-beta A4 precursor protein-binding family A member 2 isoform X1 [Morone saxatilis]XP_035520786.1 amyloid-beta A4 precursor protein-binding family A member 2 isoform X1 [Morone saxatilis]
MAHGKRPGTISKILAPSPPRCPGPGFTSQTQKEQQGLVSEASEQPPCSLKNANNDQLTPPVPANHYYMSCDPSPEDMEDTCSEYDNVGSDVEQDYDEVLHLNREGVVDTRYYKQYCPEDGGYIKHAVGDNINENSSAVDQFIPRPRQSTEICEGSQSDTMSHKVGHRFRSHCAPTAGDEAEREVEKGQENRFFFSDGDEIEEVLDGAKFIEDLEEAENSVQRQTNIYQDNENERIRKGGDDMGREDDTRVARNHNIPGGSKKCELSHVGSKEKERQGKGRGRRGTGEDIEHVVSGIKGCTTNSTEQRPKMSSKDCKKVAVRTKARSGSRQHPPPPPRHSHAQSPADTQKAQARRETPPVPRPSPSSAASLESEPRVIEPSLAPHHTTEQQREPLEERQRRPEKPQQQVEKPGAAVIPEDVPEQPRRPPRPELVPAEESDAHKKTQEAAAFPSFEDVPGPCEPEDLIDGIIFAANYLGCTQVLSDKNPSKSVRMSQAHEAVSRIKSQDEDSQLMTEVDLFISTKAVKVLNADTQETMMDSALRTISYIADIGSIVVLMARRRMSQASSEDFSESPDSASEGKSQYRMICYVFESEDAQLIAQSIGQAFSVAYREFLRANGINPTDLSQKQYSDIINSQEMYHDDLVHFSNSDNCKELYVEKQKGESLGVVIVESGWGSILPTVILASMLNSGPAARSGKLSVGDQIMSINDTSLVGLPLATCQGIIKGLKNQVKVKLSIVSCPPVTTVLIKRPDLKFQLGFSVQNGIICSLMRGGIAERGGVRVGHRIIEINGQSVVAMAHEKIVQTLSVSVGEINMKTMPAVMFRLLTGQETPIYI